MILKRSLNDLAGKNKLAKFTVLGDFNTMGAEHPFKKKIPDTCKIKRIDPPASRNKMRLLKTYLSTTCSNGNGLERNLDHVLATKNSPFKKS